MQYFLAWFFGTRLYFSQRTYHRLVIQFRKLRQIWFKFKLSRLLVTRLRCSRSEVFCKNSVLKNFAKFTWKHLCQSLFFNKVAGDACNFIKKETLALVLSCEFCEIFKNTHHGTPFFIEQLSTGCFCRLNSTKLNWSRIIIEWCLGIPTKKR